MVTPVHRRDHAPVAPSISRQPLLSAILLAPMIPALAQERALQPGGFASRSAPCTPAGARVRVMAVLISRHARRLCRLHPDLLEQLERRGLLTIGEGDKFVRSGGVLGFVPVAQTVRFAVNLDAGRRAGLRISSRMLALAVVVYDSSSPR